MADTSGLNILCNLSDAEYQRIIKLVEEAIIATDLAQYLKNRGTYAVGLSLP